MKFCREILETLDYHMIKPEFSISPRLKLVPGCDGQTDRRTDRIDKKQHKSLKRVKKHIII